MRNKTAKQLKQADRKRLKRAKKQFMAEKARLTEKEKTAKRADYEKRRDAMMEQVRALSEKYRIDIYGVLQYKPEGVFPLVAFVDAKDKYEAMTAAAKEAEAKQATSDHVNGKEQAKSEPSKSPPPIKTKLEV